MKPEQVRRKLGVFLFVLLIGIFFSMVTAENSSNKNREGSVHKMSNSQVEIVLDKTFPQALRYKYLPGDAVLLGGYEDARHEVFITEGTEQEGKAYPAKVTRFQSERNRVFYTLRIPDFKGGLDVKYEFSLNGNVLSRKILSLSGPGEPYLVSLRLDTPVLRINTEAQENAKLAFNTERSPDRFSNYQGDQDADVIGPLAGQPEYARLTDWAFLYTDKVIGTAYNTLIDVPFILKTIKKGENNEAALYDRKYYYRLAYLPNDGTKLKKLQRHDTKVPFESRVHIGGDTNGNKIIDWQDGAIWIRRQLPKMSDNLTDFMKRGGTWQQCHGTFPNNPTTSSISVAYDSYASQARRTYYMTDGAPQAYAIAGWQQHGHDWRWSDWKQPVSPGAGGEKAAFRACKDALKYGSHISFHVNQEISTPESDTYDTNVMARQDDGSERLYTAVFGQGTFRVRSYFLDWVAGNTQARMKHFFENQFWSPVIVYNDQLWDNVSPYNGVYGIHESFAKKKIIDEYLKHKVNVVTEGFQPTNLRNGLMQWKYHDMSSLISNFIAAGIGTAQMNTRDPYFLIFGSKITANARNGNITKISDFSWAIEDHYLYGYLSAYLRQHQALEYLDDENISAVRWSGGVVSRYVKDRNLLEVMAGDVLIARGEDRFIPDLIDPKRKIHVYSKNGSLAEWLLPEEWRGLKQVDLYELTDSGKVYIDRLSVTKGKVTLAASRQIPCIITPASGRMMDPGPVNSALGANAGKAVAAIDGDATTVWRASSNTPVLEITFPRETEMNRIEIEEEGNNVTSFRVEYSKEGNWTELGKGTFIGARKQLLFPNVRGEKVRLHILSSKQSPGIKEFKVFADSNLSLNSTPSASSHVNIPHVFKDDKGVDVTYNFNAIPALAADGALSTFWQPAQTENAFLEMSFIRPTKVNRAVIHEMGDNVSGFKLQIYKNSGWLDVHTGTRIGNVLEVNFPTVTTEKVRLLITSGKAPARISEFGLFGVDTVNDVSIAKGNIARHKKATQSSTYTVSFSPATASRAVDGNINGHWNAQSIAATDGTEDNPWWMVDLEKEYPISVIKLFGRTHAAPLKRLSDVDVMIMNQAEEKVWSYHLKEQPDPSSVIIVSQEGRPEVKGRYVKIQMRKREKNEPLEIAECEVYEKSEDMKIVDKTELKRFYNNCLLMDEALYTQESWLIFKNALNEVKKTLNDKSATENDVEKVQKDLFYARERIKEKEGDKSRLDSLIKSARELLKQNDQYTPESLERLKKSVEKAEKDLKTVVTASEIESAAKTLEKDIKSLGSSKK